MKNLLKMGNRCTTQLAKMGIHPKFAERTADVVMVILLNTYLHSRATQLYFKWQTERASLFEKARICARNRTTLELGMRVL